MRLKKMTHNLEYNYLKRQFSYVSRNFFSHAIKSKKLISKYFLLKTVSFPLLKLHCPC